MASGSGKARKDAPRSTHRSPGSGDPEYSKFRFEPIEFDVQEILQAAKQTSKVANTHKSSVVNKHKAYKSSKEDANRADLYGALLAYLKKRDLDTLKTEKFFRKLDHAVFEFNSEGRGLSKEDLKRKTAQKLTRNILGTVSERKISAMTGYLRFLAKIDNPTKSDWSSFALRDGAPNAANGDSVSFIKKLKSDVFNQLTADEEENMDYFLDYAVDGDLVFLGICHAITSRKTKRSFYCFCYKLESDALFVSGNAAPSTIQVVVENLGFASYVNSSLNGIGLHKLIEAHGRELHQFNMKEMKRKIVESEQKRNEEGINAFNPKREKLTTLQAALLHDERDAPNPIKKFDINFAISHRTDDGEIDDSKAAVLSKTRITVTGNADEYFAEMLREGLITDITPFLKLKHKRANAILVREGANPQ